MTAHTVHVNFACVQFEDSPDPLPAVAGVLTLPPRSRPAVVPKARVDLGAEHRAQYLEPCPNFPEDVAATFERITETAFRLSEQTVRDVAINDYWERMRRLSDTSATARTLEMIEQASAYSKEARDNRPDAEPVEVAHAVTSAMTEIWTAFQGSVSEDAGRLALQSFVNGLTRQVGKLKARETRLADALDAAVREHDGTEIANQQVEEAKFAIETNERAIGGIAAAAGAAISAYTALTGRPAELDVGKSAYVLPNQTASVVDALSYLKDKRLLELEQRVPKGTLVTVVGAKVDWSTTKPAQAEQLWRKLDRMRAKYPDVIVQHSGGKDGLDAVVARWARETGTPQVIHQPWWKRDGNGAGFRAIERMLRTPGNRCLITIRTADAPADGRSQHAIATARDHGLAHWHIEI